MKNLSTPEENGKRGKTPEDELALGGSSATPPEPHWVSQDIVCLFGARALRSVALGYIGIVLPIYLAELGYSAVYLGTMFSLSALASAIIAALTGVLADRLGRKLFIVVIPLMMTAGCIVFAFTRNFTVMVLAASLGTFGFPATAGMGGGWGPYYPAAQSLIAEKIADLQRTSVFGVLSFVGVVAAALGSLLAAAPGLLHHLIGISMFAGYRALFLFAALLSLLMAVVVLPVRESSQSDPTKPTTRAKAESANPPREELHKFAPGSVLDPKRKRLGLSAPSWRLIVRFMITNAVNGLAIGMLGPFVVYWFYRRFGASASDLARLFFLINLLATLPYLLAGRLTRLLGTVSTVASTRIVSAAMLFVMVVMPSFLLAALLYALRMIAATLSIPVRQSFLMGVIEPSERASAAGISSLPTSGAQALSAYFAGFMMQNFALSLPLELAAVLQAIFGGLYWIFFKDIRPPEEEHRVPGVMSQ
ncbi:MAG: MFS transporter [Candidatus Binataceae bacterium]